MIIFYIVLFTFIGLSYFVHRRKEYKERLKRFRKFQILKKDIDNEYTSGKYDFETYKSHINSLKEQFHLN